MLRRFVPSLFVFLVVGFGPGCGDDAGSDPDSGMADDAGTPRVRMRLAPGEDSFYASPYPFDLRIDGSGAVALDDFPNPLSLDLVSQAVALASEPRNGFSLLPVVSFGFDGPIDPSKLATDFEQVPEPPHLAFFVNVDPDHPRYGERVPALAHWYPEASRYIDDDVLTLAPWPGRALAPATTYAAVLLASVGDDEGRPLAQSDALRAALAGESSSGPDAERLGEVYAPLRAWLAEEEALDARDVGAATVFSTAMPADDMRQLVKSAVDAHEAELADPLALEHDDDAFCVFEGRLALPQFQRGEPPFGEAGSGRLAFDGEGRLQEQRRAEVPFVLAIPNGVEMPAEGFPYLRYVHGSGGRASEIVDRGPVREAGGEEEPWRGPGWVAARRGLAAGSHAMPISPDRVEDVESFDYFQIGNLGSVLGNFRQGLIELALHAELMEGLRFDGSDCPGLEGEVQLDMSRHVTMGHSMGAMYANLFGAISSYPAGLVSTGSGGYWSFFIFSTTFIPDASSALATLLRTSRIVVLDHLHPVLGLVQQVLDPVDPAVYAPHLVHDPLDGVPSKHLYVPFGIGDRYFSPQTQRAMSIAYGIPRVGEEVIDGTAAHLSLFYGTQEVDYPVAANLRAGDGRDVTAAQAQYEPDPFTERGHNIAFHRDEVRHQYGCFIEQLVGGGPPVIVAPNADDAFAPCE